MEDIRDGFLMLGEGTLGYGVQQLAGECDEFLMHFAITRHKRHLDEPKFKGGIQFRLYSAEETFCKGGVRR